jgi:hypothetical protein
MDDVSRSRSCRNGVGAHPSLVTALVASGLAGCGLTVIGTFDPIARDIGEASPIPDASRPAEVSVEPDAKSEAETSAPPAPRPFCDPSDTSLVACFDFDGTIVDASSHRQHADVSGPTFFVSGLHGRALLMDDLSRVHLPDNPAWKDGELSVEMRFRPFSMPVDGARVGLLDKDLSFGLFLHPGGSVSCTMNGYVEAVIAQVATWTHVACVNDGTDVILYADGAAKASAPAAGTVVATGEVVAIGGNSPDGEPFLGAIDDLRVFARARTPDEIAAAAKR